MPTRHDAPSPHLRAASAPRAAKRDAPRFPFADYPEGWFAVALSEDIEPGENDYRRAGNRPEIREVAKQEVPDQSRPQQR